jgi:hypothetical protein
MQRRHRGRLRREEVMALTSLDQSKQEVQRHRPLSLSPPSIKANRR